MTSASLNKLLKALDAVKKDHTCAVCSKFCNQPVTLSKCFHIICAEHFEELKFCPICKTDLGGCTTYFSPQLADSVNATKELDKFFQSYAANELSKNPEEGASQTPGTSGENTKEVTKNSNIDTISTIAKENETESTVESDDTTETLQIY